MDTHTHTQNHKNTTEGEQSWKPGKPDLNATFRNFQDLFQINWKMGKDLSKLTGKEIYEKCSTSLIINERLAKTKMAAFFTHQSGQEVRHLF